MAERSGTDTFLEGVKYGLEKVGQANITLKPKQEEILKIIVLTQKDVLAVLPTGYGKSLIYQIMPPLMDYMDSGQRPTQTVPFYAAQEIIFCLMTSLHQRPQRPQNVNDTRFETSQDSP